MGKVVRSSDLDSRDILRLVSDVGSSNARNFLTTVVIVEINRVGEKVKTSIWPIRECGYYFTTEKNKKVFIPDVEQALAYPFTLPSGGSPLLPSGVYAIPSYPLYDAHFREFSTDSKKIMEFINARMKRTPNFNISKEELDKIVIQVYETIKNYDHSGKNLGLMLLAIIDGDSPYQLTDPHEIKRNHIELGESKTEPGKVLVADTDEILKRFWLAKFAEGQTCGSFDQGACTICGRNGRVVSGYNKALLWIPTTWEAPFPFGKDDKLVESIALCKECYSDLTVGASLFVQLSQPVDRSLTKEVFAPTTSPVGREYFRRSDFSETIYGSMWVLPLLDTPFDETDSANEWATSLFSIASFRSDLENESRKIRHLKNITGFEARLPEEWAMDDFRISLAYYSGDPGKLNIFLRAIIEDILPSTAQKLQEICDKVLLEVGLVMDEHTSLGDKTKTRKRAQIGSLPYLLTMAFGSSYVWGSMEKAFKRQPLDYKLFYKNAAIRMAQNAKLKDGFYRLQEDTIDYLAIHRFLSIYDQSLVVRSEGGEQDMKPVNELISYIWETPIERLIFTSLDELGFSAGQIVQRFGNYYYSSKGSTHEKDFIKHRIMTFGSSLTPDVIRYKALGRMEEYNLMLNLGVPWDLLQRAAQVTMGFYQWEGQLNMNKERFMAAFWAGYSLARRTKTNQS
jgi:hypothetical protein